MDALDILKSDHQRIKSLFDQLLVESGKQQKKLLFENLRDMLDEHARIEETVFYPAFQKFPDFAPILKKFIKAHHDSNAIFREIPDTEKQTAEWDLQIQNGMKVLIAHIDEEESEMFPMVRKIMKRFDREQIGRLLMAAKQELSEAA